MSRPLKGQVTIHPYVSQCRFKRITHIYVHLEILLSLIKFARTPYVKLPLSFSGDAINRVLR